MLLKGADLGKYLLYRREFTLLPGECEINCASRLASKDVVLECTGPESGTNLSFMEELRQFPFWEKPERSALAIHSKLAKVLNGFFAYSTDESRYPALYEAVLILLRTLYETEELARVLYPLLHGNEPN